MSTELHGTVLADLDVHCGATCIVPLQVRQVNLSDPNYPMMTYAGTGTQGDTGDAGDATSATLDNPSGLLLAPNGDLFISST